MAAQSVSTIPRALLVPSALGPMPRPLLGFVFAEHAAVKAAYPHAYHRTTRTGQMVYYDCPGRIDARAMLDADASFPYTVDPVPVEVLTDGHSPIPPKWPNEAELAPAGVFPFEALVVCQGFWSHKDGGMPPPSGTFTRTWSLSNSLARSSSHDACTDGDGDTSP